MAVSKDGLRFFWKIENFSMLPHTIGEKLMSDTFVVGTSKKVEFCLWLYPKSYKNEDEGYISLFLSKALDRSTEPDLKFNFSLTIESTEPSREISNLVENHAFDRRSWGFPRFVSAKAIDDNKQLYLPYDTLTIRCEVVPIADTTEITVNVKSEPDSNSLKKSCVSRTCIAVHRRTIMWSIHNIRERIDRQEQHSIFLVSSLTNLPSLKLTITFYELQSDDCFPILIKQTCASSKDRLFVKCKVTVISARRKYQDSKESSHLYELNEDVWQFPSFIRESMLTTEKYLYVDNTLFLRCEFSFSYKNKVFDLENNCSSLTFDTSRKTYANELSIDLGNIYANEKFCDMELNACGKSFPYYKAILCARSSVFSAMFENNMKEKNSNVIEISDIDPDTLKVMLEFLHSDVLEEDLSHEKAFKLYKAADKYDVESLKRRCAILLLCSVSVTNVCDLLTLADAHQDDFLTTGVHDFIGSHTNEIFPSAQWKCFMDGYPELSRDIMHQMWMGKFHL